MNISEVFIRRPVATILLVIGGLIGGIAAYLQLPVAALPEADFPTVNVSAQLAGASPDTMASSVATPLIKQFETIAGIDTISATSSLGNTSITLQFNLSRNIDAAAADVQAAITRAQRQLPDNLTTPPSYRKANPADAPVIILALTGDGARLTQMDDIAQNIISPALSTISGVAQAQVYGSKTYAVRVEVDPDKLDSRSLSLSGLGDTIAAANSQTPVGTLQNGSQALTVNAKTQRTNAEEFKSLIISGSGNRIVRLSDVANVLDSVENINQGSWLDGKQSIALAVQRQPGSNTVAVVDAIKAKLPEIEAALPAQMHISVVNDVSRSIRDAVADVQKTLGITIVLVVLVIFLFLGQFWATMIPGLAVPLSLVATFAAMYAFGFSIDNISLLALTLAVGLVVDDAIVMLENIVRYTEQGMQPFEAAIKGSQEVTGTIISMSLSLVAVFLPILLMGGIVGRVLNEFGMVVTLAILSSALVSLTVTPMLAARLPHKEIKPGRIARLFDQVTESYGRAVGWCLRHRALVLLVFGLSFLGSIWSFTTLPRSFFPQEDIGLLTISTQARQDISYQAMRNLQQQAAAIVSENPAVQHVTASLGSGPGGSTFNTGSLLVQLKARDSRPPLDQTLSALRKSLAALPGISAYITPVQNLRFGGRSTQSQYQIVLQSLDADEARSWSVKLADAMKAEPQTFVDVASDLQNNALQASIEIDHDKAGSLGISSQAIRSTLEAAYGTLTVSQIQTTGNSYDVILELDQNRQWDETQLGALRVPSSSGTLVPLASFATIKRTNGPVTVNQSGQLASVTLSFNLPAGVSLGTATDRVTALRSEIGMPASVSARPSGAAQIFAQSTGNMGLLILAAVATIYIVLGVLYESFAHPLTILSGLPSAAFGALITLQLSGFDLSIIALIGLLMLIGIVKKNAIMMVDVALYLKRDENHAPEEAIHQAAIRRFRPIMMTTFCALLAAVPVALGGGQGSELRQPLGVAVVGGLVLSQVLTLFITPVIFVEIDRLASARWFLRRTAAPHEA
ncbi:MULTISPECIES: efflux RND transporter permease subunit [Brucella/Ochrobactrum group]|uniref:Acriflavin resistance protein n=1 Tax=Ochrobactrum soli TaxID=2448455 RepID=A0A2P9HI93_9HYPH|nr:MULTISPECIES: efflux RND transporter permease subunit [Brucella]RRD23799.1 efflux RND transporter permease subunit [Brucellaceae bacterium VT-16-1752]MDX4075139.1 efflux RND transporter permease subunit [Brucella sp. NBRC 113783]RLL73287.1 efflux RND transporter permease subunit [[Ochrobactrum] soli]WHS33760.1 efflux RND transporter permease subunit [Brucella sp. NM4]SPL63802.1 Acriflavin resistance protein [[Ochrobactrum] soli]